MIQFSSGTICYTIPGIKNPFPLEITKTDSEVTAYCPYFNEYGHGTSCDEAMNDLSSSLVDLRTSLRRHIRRLCPDDLEILKRLDTEEE
jgi:hypothetical protein